MPYNDSENKTLSLKTKAVPGLKVFIYLILRLLSSQSISILFTRVKVDC